MGVILKFNKKLWKMQNSMISIFFKNYKKTHFNLKKFKKPY